MEEEKRRNGRTLRITNYNAHGVSVVFKAAKDLQREFGSSNKNLY